MVTPWFAAGAGMVIAAAVAVDSPAALTYGPAAPGVRCTAGGCASQAPGHQPGLATANPGVPLKASGGAAAANSGAPRREAAGGAGYRLGYEVIRRQWAGFTAIITMPGDLKPGPWSLEFGFPAARIDRVWGAAWRPSGDGQAGTALGPRQWGGHAPGGPGANQLIVQATGTPSAPSSCELDGTSCTFG